MDAGGVMQATVNHKVDDDTQKVVARTTTQFSESQMSCALSQGVRDEAPLPMLQKFVEGGAKHQSAGHFEPLSRDDDQSRRPLLTTFEITTNLPATFEMTTNLPFHFPDDDQSADHFPITTNLPTTFKK